MSKLVVFTLVATISSAWAYSAGAPEATCDDMTPKHPVTPQISELPYKIHINKDQVKKGEKVEITISGKIFKGYFLQVRNDDGKAVGQFQIDEDDKYSKSVDCHESKGSGATHKNATPKNDFTIVWKAPTSPGKYTVYATVVQDGGTFWTQKPTEVILVE